MVRTRNQGVLQMFNKIMHVSVNTNDIDKVKQFYSNTFTGLVTEEPSSSSVMIRSNDKKLGVEFKSTNEKINLGNVRYAPILYECIYCMLTPSCRRLEALAFATRTL
jgi:catechol-2,3-dioxygenase